MNDNKWTEYFFYQKQRVRVMLTHKNITLQYQQLQETVSLDFSSKFQTVEDKYENVIYLVIYGKRTITLAHNNPTVLEQWQQILNKIIHQTDFHRYFQSKNKIGEGTTSNVFLALRKSDRRKMSVKVFPKSKLKDSKDLGALQNEMEIIKSIKGDFFPQFIASFSTENSYYLVYEWCEGISLKQWVSKGLSNQRQMKHIILSICDALRLLNNHNIAHRDIKPENIIYDLTNHKIKVIDFGFATKFTSQHHIYPSCGTPGYAAPEVLEKSKILITPQVDIFSLGVTIYFLTFAKLPYSSKYNLLNANKDCLFSFDHSLAEKTTLYELLKRMICPLKHRLTLNEVINHSYFKQRQVTCNRQLLKTQIFMKLQRNETEDLDILNKKIEKKREQRLQRQRMTSVRNQRQMRACSREKSTRNRLRFVTEIF